ncbi:rhodanese-like domain-containing protein [Leifsonia sp. H3M29-4]|uniref:rhodanese-like domain-containing protein n=1 Tax=Salinibacterium metalliresistens TaxID=3031321 RepID=UPI0023DCE96A|nr:rhodanese-like domain-containing protein [Salinibacterium metalliresistens]MDF1479788.1 rhodanese-like domain-containing protein [Salinibacterium metalliresistens]
MDAAIGTAEAVALAAAGTPLIDVREQNEWDAGHAPEAVLLPMSQIQERLGELPDGRMLIVCHSGARSARVTEYLRAQGHDAASVEGGMVAWPHAGGSIVSEA